MFGESWCLVGHDVDFGTCSNERRGSCASSLETSTYGIGPSGQSLGGLGFRGASPLAATRTVARLNPFLPCSPMRSRPRLRAKGGHFVAVWMKAGERARTVDISLGNAHRFEEVASLLRECGSSVASVDFAHDKRPTASPGRVGNRETKTRPDARSRRAGGFCLRAVSSRPRSVRRHQATVRCRRERTPAAPIARAARPLMPGTVPELPCEGVPGITMLVVTSPVSKAQSLIVK